MANHSHDYDGDANDTNMLVEAGTGGGRNRVLPEHRLRKQVEYICQYPADNEGARTGGR